MTKNPKTALRAIVDLYDDRELLADVPAGATIPLTTPPAGSNLLHQAVEHAGQHINRPRKGTPIL